MTSKSEYVIAWRKRTKRKMVEAMGGCCQICSYNRCNEALEFHHLDPAKKEFSFGKITASPKALAKIIEELKKCILLCANCRREVHTNLVQIPQTFTKLDESKLISEVEIKRQLKRQHIKNVDKNLYSIHKGDRIYKRKPRKIKIYLSKDELIDLLDNEFNGNKSALARHINVSEAAIRKKLRA